MTPRLLRAGMGVLAAVLVLGCVAGLRVAFSGRSDLATARECRDAGLPSTAIDFAARAARWYLPVGGVSREGRELLATLADEAARTGDAALSLRAWQELRGAIRATRWLARPDEDLLDRADHAIAKGMAAIDRLPDGRPGLDEAGHLEFLRRDSMPRTLPAALASLLFLAWVAVTGVGAWRSLTPEGRLRGRAALSFGLASAALLGGWLLCLSLA